MHNVSDISRVLLPVAAFFLLALSACDTLVSEAEEPVAIPRSAAVAPGFSVHAAQGLDSLFFGGLLHWPLGQADLHVSWNDSLLPPLVISNIGSTGKDGFGADLGGAHGVRRTFEPINLSQPGASVSWQAYIDSLPPLALQLKNRDGRVGMQADFSALAPNLTAQVFNDSLLVHTTDLTIVKYIYIDEFMDRRDDLALESLLSSPGNGIAAELAFAQPVLFGIQGKRVAGNRLRIVLPDKVPVTFSQETWHFWIPSGTSSLDVVSTDVEVFGNGS